MAFIQIICPNFLVFAAGFLAIKKVYFEIHMLRLVPPLNTEEKYYSGF